MKTDRREFLTLAATGLSAELFALAPLGRFRSARNLKAIAFDAFAIFDPTSIQRVAERLFPGRSVELCNLWRIKQFEYQWLHALIGRYADFWRCAEDSLEVVARSLKLDLSLENRKRLMNAYLQLQAWPDAPETLSKLDHEGLHLAFLSNATSEILQAGIKNSSLGNLFNKVLSTDSLRTFKPSPRAYQLAVDAFGFDKTEILFVAFAGWDAAGAKAFGYPTFWINRLNSPAEQLGFLPDGMGQTLDDVVAFVKG